MNQKKVAKFKDLPPEFALEKYEDVRHFRLIDWLSNLQTRLILEQPRPYAREKCNPVEVCRKLLDSPLFAPHESELLRVLDAVEVSTVRDFKACDLFWPAREYMDGRFAKIMGTPTSISVEELAPDDPFLDGLEMPFYKLLDDCKIVYDGELITKVNLNATDDNLTRDFAAWLARTRQATGITTAKKQFDQRDFDQWEKYRILPYLDLTMWARVNNVQLTQQTLGEALFPNEIDVSLAERIRKVIDPVARKMRSQVFLETLRSQLANGMKEAHAQYQEILEEADRSPPEAPWPR